MDDLLFLYEVSWVWRAVGLITVVLFAFAAVKWWRGDLP